MNPLDLITSIRESFIGSETVYKCGSCYQFFKILKVVFPEAEAYYNSSHVITKIDGVYYDINGKSSGVGYLRMEEHYPNSAVKTIKFNIVTFNFQEI